MRIKLISMFFFSEVPLFCPITYTVLVDVLIQNYKTKRHWVVLTGVLYCTYIAHGDLYVVADFSPCQIELGLIVFFITTGSGKICFAFVSVCFVKPKIKNFCFFQCCEPISKQPKQTELFRNKPKQTETTLNFLKNTQIYSLLSCLGVSSFVSVQSKHRNSLFWYRSETTKTNCFETNR
jgi:hypothetical protein